MRVYITPSRYIPSGYYSKYSVLRRRVLLYCYRRQLACVHSTRGDKEEYSSAGNRAYGSVEWVLGADQDKTQAVKGTSLRTSSTQW